MRRGCLGTRPKRRLALRVSLLCAVTVVLALPGRALAHVEVVPTDSPAGVTERYAIRIPTEKPVPTVRLEIEFPSGLRVADIEASPGWQVSVQTDSSGRPIGAVWEGGSIPAGQFAELRLTAQNPEGEAQLRWSVIQTYSDATEVHVSSVYDRELASAQVIDCAITTQIYQCRLIVIYYHHNEELVTWLAS